LRIPTADSSAGVHTDGEMNDPLDQLLAEARMRRSLPEPPLRRLLRERAGLSQQEVADAIGVSRPAVTRWENGLRLPRTVARARYAELLERLREEVAA
jgi:DNA-binding XRE family transcriptional regulator